MMEKHLGWKILTWKERPTYNLISEKGFFQKRIAWSTPHGVVIDAMGIAIVWAKASPSGSRADHSLHGLWQSQTPKGAMALFGDSVDCRFFSIKIIMIWYVVQLSWIFLVRALFIFTCTACTRGTLPPKWKAPLSRSSVAFRRQGWYTQSPLNSQMHWNYFRLLCFVFCCHGLCWQDSAFWHGGCGLPSYIPRYRKVIGHWRRCPGGSDGGYWGWSTVIGTRSITQIGALFDRHEHNTIRMSCT